MGNCCGKESEGGGGGVLGGGSNFKGQGRTLGDAPPRPAAAAAPSGGATASIPAAAASSPGRTLGGGAEGGNNARSAAAAAAEARAGKPMGTDKLSQNLAAQKKAGMKGALNDAAEENRRHREIDQSAQDRNFS